MMVSNERGHIETLLQCQNCGDIYTIRKKDKCYCEKCILFWDIEDKSLWNSFLNVLHKIFRR